MSDGVLKDEFRIGNFRIKVRYEVISDIWRFSFIPTEEFRFEGDAGRKVYYMLWRMEYLQDKIKAVNEGVGNE